MEFHGINMRGKFWVHKVANQSTHPHAGTEDEARLLYSEADDRLYVGTPSQWLKLTTQYDIFAQNTKILMGKWPLPDGWTIDTSYDDIIPLLTDTGGEVGDTGGSWTIAGISQTGSHTHNGATGGPNQTIGIGGSEIYTTGGSNSHTHTIQADGLHQHTFDGTWRPAYVKMTVATWG